MKMSIKEMKALITSAGLSFSDCTEKSEIQVRAKEAQKKLAESGESLPKPPPQVETSSASSAANVMNTQTLSAYECLLKGPRECLVEGSAPDLLVVILHGFGATNQDFSSASEIFMQDKKLKEKKIVFVLPQAPVGTMGMPEWWQIDVMKWMTAFQTGDQNAMAKIIRDEPPGLAQARENMIKLLEESVAKFSGLSYKRIVFAGFSQGAMTCADASLSLPTEKEVGGVMILSGAPLVVDSWATKLKAHQGIRVLMTHGVNDPTLPFTACGWNKSLWEANGAKVEFHTHSEGHSLGPQQIIKACCEFLSKTEEIASAASADSK